MDAEELWRKAVDKLLKTQQLPLVFSELLEKIKPKSFENDYLSLETQDLEVKQKIEINISHLLSVAFEGILERPIAFSINLKTTVPDVELPKEPEKDYSQKVYTTFEIEDNQFETVDNSKVDNSENYDSENKELPTISNVLEHHISEKTDEHIETAEELFEEIRFRNKTAGESKNDEVKSFMNNLQNDNSKLIPSMTFENFITGGANSFAASACLAVCEKPGFNYNPVLIHGNSGMGKTHLLHAIGNKIRSVFNSRILYCTADEFISDYTGAIRDGNMHKFKNKYAGLDVLLIDDVQFFANKSGSQEQFIYVFNQLVDSGKQVAMSSDVPPDELENIPDRLRTRMKNTVVGLGAASPELKIAILQNHATEVGQPVPLEVMEIISSHSGESIRELLGLFRTVINYLIFAGKDLTKANALEFLSNGSKEKIINRKKSSAPETIVKNICEFFNCSYEQVVGATRQRSVVFARNMAAFILRKITHLSLSEIGDNLGGRDHSTILNCCNRAEEIIKKDETVFKQISIFLNINEGQQLE
ncbi:MAG: chromosomal replication initiator protein DnaA [Bifidobacteriaceae bacterium]|jgi:chromosomal replication initiator protein|nr:chromosomal replication initiator protein DnaA [Bifidobacteriaceae bacterium]